jgi:conjugative relaxase-like TrwC/TraI family protein/excisionase family DNA binding protein
VLSIGKLAAGQAKYYLEQAQGRVDAIQSVASGAEDYYTHASEARGVWLGRGAATLELCGVVGANELRSLLEGVHPRTGEPLRHSSSPVRVAAFDLTFSAPKSVSLLYALGDTDAVRVAHDRAVREAFGYLERSAASVRRGRGGATVLEADGLAAAAFRHRTSRAGDPQLHTHVVVANVARGADLKWSALDGRRLYTHARAASFIYQAVLRAALTRELGVEWTEVRDGIAEIVGVPAEVVQAFSRRRAEIEASLAERGTDGPRAAEAAALATRRVKDHAVDPERLAGEWRDRAAELGFDDRGIDRLTHRGRGVELDDAFVARITHALLGPDGLTAHESSFARRDVIEALCNRLPGGIAVNGETLERLADGLLADDRVAVVAQRNPEDAGRFVRRDGRSIPIALQDRRFSTVELLAVEQRLVDRAVAGIDAGLGVALHEHVERSLAARPTMSDEQVAMVRSLTSDGAGVAVVLGRAGAGKTFALSAAHEAWARSDFPVLGAAVARHAAQQLEAETAIPSVSLAQLVAGLQRGERLPYRIVLVVDEAGMAGTRQLATMLDHVESARGKLVLVGDDRQLAAIDAGGAFGALARRGLAIELTENRRQRHAWEREAVEHLRAGRGEEAIAAYRAHDRVVVELDEDSVRERLVADWRAADEPSTTVMIALRRVDVSDLNARARVRMRSAGALGAEELELRAGGFSVGDHVLIRKNHIGLDISNGQRGVVVGVDVRARRLDLEVDGRRVSLGSDFLDDSTRHGDATLTHGYAITGHAAQGTTVDRAFVLVDPSLTQEWGYTALTRGRESNHLYLAAGRAQWRDEFAPQDPEPPDPIAQLVRALSKSNAQTLAIDGSQLITAAGELRRLESARVGAERHEADAARIRRLREARVSRWRPKTRRDLDDARAAEAAAAQRASRLRKREQAPGGPRPRPAGRPDRPPHPDASASPRARPRPRPERRAMSATINGSTSGRRGLTRDDLMKPGEVARLLDVPVSTVLHWGRNGTLPRHKLGRHVRFVRSEVEAAILAARGE